MIRSASSLRSCSASLNRSAARLINTALPIEKLARTSPISTTSPFSEMPILRRVSSAINEAASWLEIP
ncbi:MAG: hypothetical protein CXT66_00860 [Methanobacteriota archaeon]|nr:MAG: hypothetical protein CXT66_00860 [Euryarchaeota archaeon]